MKIHVVLVWTILLLFFSGCAAPKETARDETVEVTPDAVEESDTTVHELLIFDSDFDRWFARNSRPMSFYDHQYLRRWNATLTREWNTISAPATIGDCRPVSYLDYDSGIDYEKELDYQLFYYFRYMHQRCRLFSQTPGQWR